MIEIQQQELAQVSAAGISEASCVAGFGALGTLGGVIGGGIFTAGVGMGVGGLIGSNFGFMLGTAICLR